MEDMKNWSIDKYLEDNFAKELLAGASKEPTFPIVDILYDDASKDWIAYAVILKSDNYYAVGNDLMNATYFSQEDNSLVGFSRTVKKKNVRN